MLVYLHTYMPSSHPRFDRVELVAILAAAVIAFRCKLVLAARRPEVGKTEESGGEMLEGWLLGSVAMLCCQQGVDWRRRHLLATSLMWSAIALALPRGPEGEDAWTWAVGYVWSWWLEAWAQCFFRTGRGADLTRFEEDAGCCTTSTHFFQVHPWKLTYWQKNLGVENAFDLHSYKALPVSFAARGNDLVAMFKWVLAILTANPQGSLLVSKCLQQRSSNIHVWQKSHRSQPHGVVRARGSGVSFFLFMAASFISFHVSW